MFELRSHYVVLAGLVLTIQNRVDFNSWRSDCMCFQVLLLET